MILYTFSQLCFGFPELTLMQGNRYFLDGHFLKDHLRENFSIDFKIFTQDRNLIENAPFVQTEDRADTRYLHSEQEPVQDIYTPA
jgi:hypothetical protein